LQITVIVLLVLSDEWAREDFAPPLADAHSGRPPAPPSSGRCSSSSHRRLL